jgi:hypothetical protein
MGEYSEAFVAWDVAKKKHAVALAEGGRTGEVRFVCEVENSPAANERTIKKLGKKFDCLPRPGSGRAHDRWHGAPVEPHARRQSTRPPRLGHAAWNYRYPARVSETLRVRLEGLPKAVRDIAWKAQVRLCARYRRLSAAGKKPPVVVAAIAREMAAFLWAIGREIAPS